MDPTTQSHIDPRTLSHNQGGAGEIPSLSAGSVSIPDPSSTGAAAYSFGETPVPVPSGKYGNALDDTKASAGSNINSVQPQSQNPFLDSKPTSDVNSSIPSTGDVKAKANEVASQIPSKDEIKDSPTVTGIRQRVNTLGNNLQEASQNVGANVNQASATISNKLDQASKHPAVENAKQGAQAQVGQLRQYLGRSPALVRLEKRLNVDRVFLVAGGLFLYLLLIPLNLFGLALPTTTLLTLVPPVLLAVRILDQDNMQDDNKTKALLAYFVVLGFIQTLESLAAGVLANRIPQYYTLKLVFLAYLLHPQTQGALKFHEAVLKPAFTKASSPTSSSYPSSTSRPNDITTPPQANTSSSSATSSPFVGQMPVKGTLDAAGNVTAISPARNEFEVLTRQ